MGLSTEELDIHYQARRRHGRTKVYAVSAVAGTDETGSAYKEPLFPEDKGKINFADIHPCDMQTFRQLVLELPPEQRGEWQEMLDFLNR